MTSLILLGLGCAAPWTLGAVEQAAPPLVTVAEPPPAEVHTVKREAQPVRARASAAFKTRYQEAGAPSVGLLVLGPTEQAFERWEHTMVGPGIGESGVVTVAGTAALPGLPTSGWKEEAAHGLQSRLLQVGVRVVDLPMADWRGDREDFPADLIWELRWVSADPLPQAQLRVIRLASGEVLSLVRIPVAMAGGDAFAWASDQAIDQTMQQLTRKL